ncbi:VanW family protein [Allokutzneria sp. A3M-2-11 16]|uniref:VanW family protein n=1 Tax=Allokutzneria sp. A3M-2-11 16 TaxID=2962043 RepID=UPI0020B869F8|nr:VanW family protein [Allokutzneria sp. A3M-2-11 16]MCP3799285.1 VanW family protein [Allokutzneria sp. A3M-2-11 16]
MSDDNGRPDPQPEHDSSPAASTPAGGDPAGPEQRPVSAERTTKRIQWMSAPKLGAEAPEPAKDTPATPAAAQPPVPPAPQPQVPAPQVHRSGPQPRMPQSIAPTDGMPRVHYNTPQPQQPSSFGAPGQPPVHHSGPQPRTPQPPRNPGQQWSQQQPGNVQFQGEQPQQRHDSGPVRREQPPVQQPQRHDSGPVNRPRPEAAQQKPADASKETVSGAALFQNVAEQTETVVFQQLPSAPKPEAGPARSDDEARPAGEVQKPEQPTPFTYAVADTQPNPKPELPTRPTGDAPRPEQATTFARPVGDPQKPDLPTRSAGDAPRPEQATTFARPVGDPQKPEQATAFSRSTGETPRSEQATTFARPVGDPQKPDLPTRSTGETPRPEQPTTFARPVGDPQKPEQATTFSRSTGETPRPEQATTFARPVGDPQKPERTTTFVRPVGDESTSRIDQATTAVRPEALSGLGAGRPVDPTSDTVRIPKIDATTTVAPAKATSVFNAKPPATPPPPPTPPPVDDAIDPLPEDDGGDERAGRGRKILLAAASVVGLLGVLYVGDLLLTQGNVPRGITVAGVDVGGLDRTSAERKLREQIEPRLGKPVALRVGDVDTEISPQEAGLTMNWKGTLDQAGEQSYNPFTRIASFFTTTELGVVTAAEEGKVTGALEHLREVTDRLPAEGTIEFTDGKPKPIDPKPGQKLDAAGAVPVLKSDWPSGRRVQLPAIAEPVTSTPEGVRKALEEIAKPAVSGPLTVLGEGGNAIVQPVAIGNAMRFESDGKGGLTASLDVPKIAEVARPQLASTDKPGKDAEIVIEGGKPVVKPSTDGRGVDWEKTLAGALEVLRKPQDRQIKATYSQLPAKLTTEQANALGIKQLVAEFDTKGFAADSGRNIRRAAEQINGAIVKPGETFSMNGRTGPRTAATGYVEAAIIEKGELSRAVGGGVSQMATTLYNASYHAGMVDVAHKEHSFYISRYPKGREATVFQNPNGSSVIDVKFKNDSKTGILIQTVWTPSSITVKMWGTKTYEVTGQTGEPFAQTAPQVKEIPHGQPCTASGGAGGFSVKDTRTIRDLTTGTVRREERTVRYNPQHKVVCAPPPAGG